VVVRALPTGGASASNVQPSEPYVVHDHIRLRQHQIITIARIGAGIRTRHVKHTSMTGGGESVGRSASGSQLSTGWRSAEMISDRCTDPNGRVLV
jgi:hypothetical protein